MKKYLLLALVISCLSAATTDPESNRIPMIVRHDTNQVEMCISNYGKFGQGEAGVGPGCWWPKGTDHTYIFGAGIWFGTVDSLTGDTLVTTGYVPQNGASEFAPGLSGMSPDDPNAIVYLFPTTWPPSPAIFPMAPLAVLSHQDSWCCYNDSAIQWHQAGDAPIGIEVYQTVYVWDSPEFEDVVWFFMDVHNTSAAVLNDCYISVTMDCDIGNETGISANDRCSGVVNKLYVMNYVDSLWVDDLGYQWQEEEEPGAPPWFPGAIGVDLLQTPFDLVEWADKDNDGIWDQFERDSAYYVNNLLPAMWDVDYDGVPDWRDASENPQFGMTALKRFTLNVEPLTDPQRYMTMAGYDFQSGLYEPFDTIPPDPDDQRFLMASGPFDLGTDSVVTVGFAIFFADWWPLYLRPDSALVTPDAYLQWYYDHNWFWPGVEEHGGIQIGECGLSIKQNPVSDRVLIAYSLESKADICLILYNVTGQLVKKIKNQRLGAGTYSATIDISKLPLGTYFLVLETPTSRQSRSFVIVR